MPDEKWSEGRSVNAAKQIPPMSFDCSGWESDIPADQWSEGRTVNAAIAIPGSVTDCSSWETDIPEHLWNEGQTVNAAVGVPGSSTDCSGWEPDVPADQWDEGPLVNAAQGVPGSVTDCSNWARKSPVWFVVHAGYAAGTPPAVVAGHAVAVLTALRRLAPDLGLEHDRDRSAVSADGRHATIAIAPTVPVADLRQRLLALMPQVDGAGLDVPVTGLSVEWDDPAQPFAA